jgi:hypothetical protein
VHFGESAKDGIAKNAAYAAARTALAKNISHG